MRSPIGFDTHTERKNCLAGVLNIWINVIIQIWAECWQVMVSTWFLESMLGGKYMNLLWKTSLRYPYICTMDSNQMSIQMKTNNIWFEMLWNITGCYFRPIPQKNKENLILSFNVLMLGKFYYEFQKISNIDELNSICSDI